jgi:hypothetical protein
MFSWHQKRGYRRIRGERGPPDWAGLFHPERLAQALRWRVVVTITDRIEINPAYPRLTREDIRAALGYKDQVRT